MSPARLARDFLRNGWQPGTLILGLLLLSSLPVQALDRTKAITQYRQTIWTKETGLPNNAILALAQTGDGYLWLGTFQGLVRFDGVQFTVLNKNTVPEFKNNTTWKLLVSSEGTLWVGTNGGGLMAYKNGQWKTFTPEHGLASEIISALFEDRQKRLWIGTRKGLNYLSLASPDQGFQRVDTLDGKAVSDIRAIGQSADGTILLGSQNTLFQVSSHTGSLALTTYQTLEGQIVALFTDRKQNFWIGTIGAGVYQERPDHTLTHFTNANGFPGTVASVFCEDRDGNLWIGSAKIGLVRITNGTFTTFSHSDGLSGEDVSSLFEDREGNLWVGTYRDGLNQFQNGKFLTYTTKEGVSHNLIWQIQEASDHSLWIGTNQGLTHLANGTLTSFTASPFNSTIYSILQDQSGTWWAGTQSNGLVQFHPDSPTRPLATFTTQTGLPSNQVRVLCEDTQGNLWLGTPAGLCRKSGTTITTFTTENGLPLNVILAITCAKDGSVWVGTDGGGLIRFQNGQFTTFTRTEGLLSNVILSLYEDVDGIIWVITNAGLCYVQEGRLRTLSQLPGNQPETLHQMIEDTQGNFWIGSGNGILRVNRKALLQFAQGQTSSVETAIFTEFDGMKTEETNVPALAMRASDGRLWFPTLRGIAMIDPVNIPINQVPPTVVMESVTANGEVMRPGPDELALASFQNTFEVTCSILSFSAPEKNRLKYRLAELQSPWNEVQGKRTLSFFNIPAGKYTLEILACNNDGVWNTLPNRLAVHIQTSPWRSPWAILVYSGIVIGLIFSTTRFRTGYLVRQNQRLQIQVAERTRKLAETAFHLWRQQQELEHQKNVLAEANLKLQEMDQLKASFTAMLAHDLKSPLSVVKTAIELLQMESSIAAGPLASLLEASDRSLDKVLTLISEMLEVSRAEAQEMKLSCAPLETESFVRQCVEDIRVSAQTRRIALEIQLEPGLPAISADRGKLERVFANLLSNALKFTPNGGKISVAGSVESGTGVEIGQHFLKISITDTGEGIPAEDIPYLFEPYRQSKSTKKQLGVGLGLTIVRRIVAAHGGNISVHSQLGVGTCFTVLLPALPPEASSLAEVSPSSVVTEDKSFVSAVPNAADVNSIPPISPRVLIAEDNPVSQKILAAQVKKLGYQVEVVNNGLEAVNAFETSRFDAILMDCYMPEMDGFTATQAIRRKKSHRSNIRIIALTAETTVETVEKCLQIGMDDFLGKPFTFEDLKALLQRWVPIVATEEG
ncbi:MAG: response regulator [Acidobacteria bacterium]|nr:response regulator [Acidobacteriota bacterium]